MPPRLSLGLHVLGGPLCSHGWLYMLLPEKPQTLRGPWGAVQSFVPWL